MHPLRFPILLLALSLTGCGGAPKEPATEPTAPMPAAPPEPEDLEPETDDSAMIEVIAGKPTEILVDGKPIGTTPISGHKVAPGLHEVTFVDEAHGNRTMMVDVGPGDAKTVQSDPAPSAVEMGDKGEKKP